MKTLILMLALAVPPAFAVDNTPTCTPLTDRIDQFIGIDELYDAYFPDCTWFDGELTAYRLMRPRLAACGMRFVTDRREQVNLEVGILYDIVAAWLWQQYARTAADWQFYDGAINADYRVLHLLNTWPGGLGPVPGTGDDQPITGGTGKGTSDANHNL